MALDGLVIHCIVNELNKKLLGGKIDKVYQPENDEVVLHIRNNKENFKLVLADPPISVVEIRRVHNDS